jgi:hypothetical protein
MNNCAGLPVGDRPDRLPKDRDDEDDEDEAPETPLDEPAPLPIVDPPPDDRPKPPLVV